MIKRLIKPLFFIPMVMVMLLSCTAMPTPLPQSGTPQNAEKTKAPQVTTLTPTPSLTEVEGDVANLKGLQIQFIHPWTGATADTLFQLVDQFNQLNEWDIHVIMKAPGSAAQVSRRLREEIVNGIHSNVVAAPISQLLEIDQSHELVVDLAPYVDSNLYGMDKELVADFYLPYWDENLVDGKRYGIPAQRSALLMAYNLTWANELGFQNAPHTADEFKVQMCAANASFRKDDDPLDDGLGGWIISRDASSMYNWLLAFDAEPFNDGSFTFSTPASEEAFTYLHGLSANHCAWMGRSTPEADYFARRQALAYTLWMQDLERLNSAMVRNESADDWLLMAYPGMEDGAFLSDGSAFAILHQDADSDLAAWLFIRWLSQPEQQGRLLTSMGTLPLGSQVLTHLNGYSEDHPDWQAVIDQGNRFVSPPPAAEWQIVSPLLEDSAWQLWVGGVGEKGVSVILLQIDDLIAELTGESR